MANTQLLRKRIKSVGSIRQITKAMELVAASKMRKAVERRMASVEYARHAFAFLQNLVSVVDPEAHPLLSSSKRQVASSKGEAKTLVIAVSSDRGLAGSFNASIIRETLKIVASGKLPVASEQKESETGNRKLATGNFSFITVGKKIRDTLRRLEGDKIVADFTGLGDKVLGFSETTPIARLAIDGYLDGTYRQVTVISTEFISSLSQKVQVRQLLPIEREVASSQFPVASKAPPNTGNRQPETGNLSVPDYLFEPSSDVVLDAVLNRLVEVQIFQALVESNASEHSARMLAMKNASDAAGDLIDDLNLTYNQERQAGITRELAEISAGSEALQGAQ